MCVCVVILELNKLVVCVCDSRAEYVCVWGYFSHTTMCVLIGVYMKRAEYVCVWGYFSSTSLCSRPFSQPASSLAPLWPLVREAACGSLSLCLSLIHCAHRNGRWYEAHSLIDSLIN